MKLIHFKIGGMVVLIIFVLFMFFQVTSSNHYINKPFGECKQNYSINYGSFRSCGDLVNEDTAHGILITIFIGLPLLAFVILPLMIKFKENKE